MMGNGLDGDGNFDYARALDEKLGDLELESLGGKADLLRGVAEKYGSCTGGASEGELEDLVESLRVTLHEADDGDGDAPGVSGADAPPSVQRFQPDIPPSIRALWSAAAEWHFTRDHCGVFGLNFFPPADVVKGTTSIFGDAAAREYWRAAKLSSQPADPSVAEAGWVLFASFSEYDYLFCCFDRMSVHFGKLRHMVNNCFEEGRAWEDAEELVDLLLDWSSAGADEACGNDDDSALSEMLWRETRRGRKVES